MWVLIASLAATLVIKSIERFESYLREKEILENENDVFQRRLGIDFGVDKERLEALAM
jgi:hypothetical protein